MSPASYQTAPPRVDVSAVDPSTRPAQSGKRDSNPRPQPWQGCALPTELFPRCRQKSNLKPVTCIRLTAVRLLPNPDPGRPAVQPYSGGEGDRTPDLVNAIHALSQLSYAPAIFPRPKTGRREHGILSGRLAGVKRFHPRSMNIFTTTAYYRAAK